MRESSQRESSATSRLVAEASEAAELIHKTAQDITKEELQNKLTELRKIENSAIWETEDWKKVVPGKRVLQKVAETLAGEGSSTQLRNVTIGLMAKDGYKPAGMKKIIDKALAYER